MRFLAGVLVFCSAVPYWGDVSAAAITIGFATTEKTVDAMGPHNRAAWEVAQTLGDATLLHVDGETGFLDTAGETLDLSVFDVIWYHQGDDIARTALYSGAPLTALRAYAGNGGAMLLSGGALAMVAPLGLERDTRPQRHQLENWRDPAAMVLVKPGHPAFAGLQSDGALVWLSRGGCPAVADFYWGSPAEGMPLGNSPKGVHRPLVEYALDQGRVIVFGWHWPDYADIESPHRANLLKLTGNLLTYLADRGAWQPVTIHSDFPGLAGQDQEGIAEPRWRALQRAIEDLTHTFPEHYVRGGEFLEQFNALEAEHARLLQEAGPESIAPIAQRFEALQREALLANPLLDFDRLLVIRRRADRLGLPTNYSSNSDLPPTGYENSLLSLGLPGRDNTAETVFVPEGDAFIGDLDLHYGAERLLLSTPNAEGRWGIAELDLATGTLTRLPLIDEPDVHNYDACYLPDERIVFCSTAPFIGVPCVGGHSKVTNLYLRDHDGQIRRLTHDQDHNWCPAILNNGRILYQRWEYADIAHTFMRILFHANPDGSQQMEYYGSNSFWPTAMFYARPIPGHPTKIVTVVGGHHDAPRQGELVILDPARGRHEADGVVQRIPGYGKPVEPVILDGLIGASWPRFLHPFPLNEHYFIVSCKPSKTALWGVYLVDVFDNFVLLHEEPGWALLEPTPWRATTRPPVVPDLADPTTATASVVLADVYEGPGLEGVPRGAVRALRIAGYDFAFHGLGGEPDRVGLDGPWDVRRILGTVPVEADGSAHFEIPACTPICVQPLDAEGKALALMRSWFTAAPGEGLSCAGCHEKQNMTVPAHTRPLAARRGPSAITPWYGPARNFSFEREVQPVLDAFCVSCHNSEAGATFDLTARPAEEVPSDFQMHFSPSYMQLRRWVHTPTLESDAHMLPPRAFHADTSKLIQILRDDHYGVELSAEAWDRLITWIDLNAPFHGTWKEAVASIPAKQAAAVHGAERRRELHRRYAGIDEDPEAIHPPAVLQGPEAPPPFPSPPLFSHPAASPEAAAPRSAGEPVIETVEIAEGVTLELVRIEPGQFTLGDDNGYPNERPAQVHTIEGPFFMGRFEITNRQYACFDPAHDSGLETGEAYQFGDDERGFLLNRPEQPVVRVSWDEALAFCEWLSSTTGRRFSLPTEIQWEYACRAGSSTPLWYGGLDDDFSKAANLSDATHYSVYYPHSPRALPPWRPADTRFNDGWRVSARVGSFGPNPWGLHDMHGNVAEWTLSSYLPNPADAGQTTTRKVVRGGSWMDRPRRARSAFRLHYEASQCVHDVGFRVVCETAGS
ncbi:MAG TPA: SUMF1/EgtB/PvdO family nonheme iron enzyme [Candidatus Hydrogenedentes bacterium]|nr:SUMF1/EgtB/PvdO family nonheme iron enzyme [Candidatus Hydrogenedentota bacterium]